MELKGGITSFACSIILLKGVLQDKEFKIRGAMMKKRIRFALEMDNGITVRDIESLKKNFSLSRVIEYLRNGKLIVWLRDRYENDLADELEKIDTTDSHIAVKVCDVFGVEYDDSLLYVSDKNTEKAENKGERISLDADNYNVAQSAYEKETIDNIEYLSNTFLNEKLSIVDKIVSKELFDSISVDIVGVAINSFKKIVRLEQENVTINELEIIIKTNDRLSNYELFIKKIAKKTNSLRNTYYGMYNNNSSEITTPFDLVFDKEKLNGFGKVIIDSVGIVFSDKNRPFCDMWTKRYGETKLLDDVIKTEASEYLLKCSKIRDALFYKSINRDSTYNFVFWCLMIIAVDDTNAGYNLSLICDFSKYLSITSGEIIEMVYSIRRIFREPVTECKFNNKFIGSQEFRANMEYVRNYIYLE